jgi:hypothetical protein
MENALMVALATMLCMGSSDRNAACHGYLKCFAITAAGQALERPLKDCGDVVNSGTNPPIPERKP